MDNKYIMFLDDDIIFSERMFHNMNKTIISNLKDENIIRYGFNQISKNNNFNFYEKFKSNFILNFLNFIPINQEKLHKVDGNQKY